MENELQRLGKLAEMLKKCNGDRERIEVLDQEPRVLHWLEKPSWLRTFSTGLSPECELIIKSLIAIDQGHHFFSEENATPALSEKLREMLEDLFPVEAFYKEIGGIIGYHSTMFSFLAAIPNVVENQIFNHFGYKPQDKLAEQSERGFYHRPPGIDISEEDDATRSYILEGIVSLPLLAEIYPVGGAADRLRFCDPVSGLSLPAAKLQFCGHTLLEQLIRDVQAREYLYYKLFGEQITTPIAMMTSIEKDNHRHILELCEIREWFGRPKDCFRIFCQPVVPTMDKSGKWCLSGAMKLLMKPGGHGVIWKVAQGEGVFDWMESLGCKKVLVRQINNPIAGIDYGILAFCGVGFRESKVFGFASCPRQVESAEGVNILIERKGPEETRFCLTNIEYCDFPKFSIQDVPVEPGSPYSQFPSNTNILFADISAVKETLRHCPIPGMLVNLKKISFFDDQGVLQEKEVARLESTMQNLADCFELAVEPSSSFKGIALKTYLTYNHRRKTISTAKKFFQRGASLLETPEGCFYDLLCNAYDLLMNYCQVSVPGIPPIESFTCGAPPFIFSYHPALGPLFFIIGQKIRGGLFKLHSELKLEIAEVDIENLTLSGSLHITAERVIGETQEEGILKYSDQIGFVRLRNISVENRGIDSSADNVYWKGEIVRHELCEILIRGNAEFIAEGVVLEGSMRIEVDSGFRVTAFEEDGVLKFKKETLSSVEKRWIYHLDEDGSILLESDAYQIPSF